MSDPLNLLLTALWNGWLWLLSFYSVQSRVTVGIEILGIISLLPLIKADRQRRKDDIYWSDVCGTLMQRMRGLAPEYEKAIADYAEHIVSRIKGDKKLLDLAGKIDANTMIKAERDLCTHDLKEPDVMASLISQLKTLKGG